MLIAMKLSPYGVRPDLFAVVVCLRLPVFFRGAGWGVAGFLMGLPKSKAQIGLGRYGGFFDWWVVWVVVFFVGLSLSSLWFIRVAPVRGGTYFLCMPQRK
jgi:hypothetical protein